MKLYLYHTLLTTVLFLLINPFAKSQQTYIDSLKQVAATATTDTAKAIALNKVAWTQIDDEPDISLQNSTQALVFAQKSGNQFIEADCYKSMGVAYDTKGNLDSCIFFLNKSLVIYKYLGNVAKQSNVLSDIAIGYSSRGIYELALKNHFAALVLRKSINDRLLLGKSMNNIGLIYRARKDYDKAIGYYQQSLAIKTALDDERGMLNTTMNLGSLYQNKKVFDSAAIFANKALVLATKLHIEQDIAGSKINIADALIGLNQFEKAYQYLQQAEQDVVKTNCKGCMPTINHALGLYYLNKKNYTAAMSYFSKGLAEATASKKTELQEGFYKDMADCYSSVGNYKIAYLYQDSVEKVAGILLNKENLRQINEMTAVYESGEKEKEIEKLNIESAYNAGNAIQRKKERNYFIIASLLFLSLAVVAYKASKANRKKKEQLNIQNKIIEKSLAEKEVLMKEIHHRVKNNLQVVSSLLNLQSNYIKDEQALDAIKESRNRVHSMALIHQNLYQEDNLTGIDMGDYINNLCDNLFSSYNISSGKVKLIKEIQTLVLDVDTVVPLGLILNELISNSLKYAFHKNNNEGVLKVIVKEENNLLQLHVYDNGIGFPENFNEENRVSFGHKMIHAFLQKMEGTIKMYNEDGAKTIIAIKKYLPAKP